MIQEPFLAMQGDPRRFRSLRDDPRPFAQAVRKTGEGSETLGEKE
jgi:hypothetical protein